MAIRNLRLVDVQLLDESVELFVRELFAKIAQQVPECVQRDIVVIATDEWRHPKCVQYLVWNVVQLRLGVSAVEEVGKLDRVVWRVFLARSVSTGEMAIGIRAHD